MKNFESVERKLVESGKADAIRQIADSADGQRLAEKLDAKKVEQAAKSGDAVLLSPACSSFDRFTDFEQRGDAFIKLVEELGYDE